MAHEKLWEMLPLLMKNEDFTSSQYKEHLQIHKEQTITTKCKLGKGHKQAIHKIRNMNV